MSARYQAWKSKLSTVGERLSSAVPPLTQGVSAQALLLLAFGIILLSLLLLGFTVHHQRATAQAGAYAEFHHLAEQQATRLNQETAQLMFNLKRLRGYVSLFEDGSVAGADLSLLKKLMQTNLQSNNLSHSNFLALEPAKARQYFEQDVFLAMQYKDIKEAGKPAYSAVETMLFRSWKDANYLNNERESWYHAGKKQQSAVVTPVYFDKNYLNARVFSITQGLYEKNRFYGAVGVHVATDAFFPLVEKIRLGRSGGAFLVDPESGEMLTTSMADDASPRQGELVGGYQRSQLNFYKSPPTNAPWQKIFKLEQPRLELSGKDGETYLLSVLPLEQLPWVLAVYQRKAEAQAMPALWPQLLGGGALAILGVLFWLLYRGRLLRPLRGLVAAINTLKSQPQPQPVPLAGTTELRELGEAVNELVMLLNLGNEQNEACTRQLGDYRHQVLEQSKQIEEREKRLEQSVVEVQKGRQETTKVQRNLAVLHGKAQKLKLYAEKAIAEMRKARQEAEHANRAKSQFLSNMSHELRTPMNAIIGYTEILQEDAEELGHYDFLPDLQKIHGASYHMLDLINNLFDLSKIESSRMDLYLETFDIAPMVQDVAATVQPLVEKQSNLLKVKMDGALGTMNADLTKVRQNLLNLLSNASKFTKQGTITLSAARDTDVNGQDWIVFEVSDTGIGMTQEQIQKLFQAFGQLETQTTRQYAGAGLGLVITQQFCRIMRGDISVTSEFGKGSTFTIRLPADVGGMLAANP
jgi:signal transduction histidine kinase